MLHRSILAAMALSLAAPALATPSTAPPGPETPQAAPAGASPVFTPPSPPEPDPLIRNPIWDRLPTADELAPLYPHEARIHGQVGKVKMRCEVLKDGTLTACKVFYEDPPGQGFAEAILASARYFKMAPTDAFGNPVEGRSVIIPLKWQTG